MPIERPSISTILRCPGATSLARPTTYSPISASVPQSVEGLRVLVKDTLAKRIWQAWEGVCRRVKVPMWIVAGEHQQMLRIGHLKHLEQMGRVVRPLDRLACQAHVVTQVSRGRAGSPGHLRP